VPQLPEVVLQSALRGATLLRAHQQIGHGLQRKIGEQVPLEELVQDLSVAKRQIVAIARSGIRPLLSGAVTMVSGPGCPVCVCGTADIRERWTSRGAA
jgi:hydrogenase expression/formation protein HypD